MLEIELAIDWKKHICYSETAKKIIQDALLKHFSPSEAEVKWEKIQQKYVTYLRNLDYLGGKKNNHNGTGGTYDCIAIFAYWEVLNRKPSLQEIYEMNNSMFLPPFKSIGKVFNMNNSCQLYLMSKIFQIVAVKDKKKESFYPEGYIMRIEPFDKSKGIHYRFERCPIAEFAKKHDLLEIMPAMCNGDYPAMEQIHATLIREHTCANSNVCDYWIVGNCSKHAKSHPVLIDEQGYMYNKIRNEL